MSAPLRDRLVADGAYTFAVRIANMLLAASVGILTARMLGPAGRGIYALPMIDAAFVTAAFAGLTSATSHFLLARAAGAAIVRAVSGAATIFLVLGAVAAVAIARVTGHPDSALAAVLALPGSAALLTAYGYAVGTERVRLNALFALASSALLLLALAAGFLLASRAPSTAIAAWVIAGDLLGALLWLWMLRDARRLPPGRVDTRAFVGYAARTGAVSMVSLLNYRADVYIVAALLSPAMLGLYTLAVTAAEMTLAATQVTAIVASPHIGKLDVAASARLTAQTVRHNVIIAACSCIALALIAPIAVRVLYGEAFAAMVPALRVLLVGVFALSLGSPMSSFFTLRLGRPEVSLTIASLSAALCIGVSLALVPRLGLPGAAIGSTSGYLVAQAAAIVYFSRTSGLAMRCVMPTRADLRVYADAARAIVRRARAAGTLESSR